MQKFLKSKIGFTLVELMVVVVILSIIIAIGIPAYRNVSKNSRIKVCLVNQRELLTQAKDYCTDNKFNPAENDPYIYTITPDADNNFGIAHYAKDPNQDSILKNAVHGGKVLCCPAGGVITITVEHGTVFPDITIKCTGGTDGDCHKPEDQTETQTQAQTQAQTQG